MLYYLICTVHVGVLLSLLEPLPSLPDVPPPLKMKQSLINVRQHEFFLKMLMVCYSSPSNYNNYY